MSDKDTWQLSRELESLKDTLTDNKPAQIPLLDDVVDEDNPPLEPPPKRRPYLRKEKRQRPEDIAPPPDTRDLFPPDSLDTGAAAPDEASYDAAPSLLQESSGSTVDTDRLREEASRMAETWLRESADKMAGSYLREQADKMVEDLVAEYSTEILSRLKERLTSQLYAILEDLDAEDDKDKS